MAAAGQTWLQAGRWVGAAALLAVAGTALAQPLEQSVKAAFLPKFARYVEWPPRVRPAPGEPLQLCMIGSDPFGGLAEQAAAGEKVGPNPVVVRHLAGAAQAGGCHVAFVRGANNQATAALLAALRPYPILTVTDARYGTARGMIHFAISNGRVGFHIDEAAAARGNLSISSRLLALALSVRQRSA